MAEDKKGFLLYADLIHTIEKMPNDKAGLLFKHILNYVNDLNPVTDDLIVELTFEPIKQQLKRDLLKYKETKIDKSNGGKLGNLKRWHKDLHDKVVKNELDINEALEIANNRKTSHTDTMQSQPIGQIAVNVNDNVNVNDINNNIIESFDFDGLLVFINSTFGKNFKLINDKVKKKYKALMKQGYDKKQIVKAMINAKENSYHKETNYQYCTPEFFSRTETIDKYSEIAIKQKSNNVIDNYYGL
jgi:hypothetical protein